MKASVGISAATGLALTALTPAVQAIAHRPAQTAHHQAAAAPIDLQLTAYRPVTVQPGETLSMIAARLGVTVASLEAANPQITNPDMIYPGQVLHEPGQVAVRASRSAPAAPGGGPTQTVQSTIYSTAGGSFAGCVVTRESGGNPRAVNPSSGAGGLFQFLPSTWASLGYSGAPQNASVATQYAAFQKLYAEMGRSPWASDGC